jgi:hypothetical protein
MRFRIISILFLSLFFISCERVVDINFPAADDVVIIEGYVESKLPPYVIITKSLPFLGNITATDFSKYFISGAVVKVSDGTDEAILKEYTFGEGFIIYSLDTSDLGSVTKFLGKEGKTYSLNVTVNINNEVRTYTSTTTLLPKVALDSIWYEPKKNDSTLFQVFGKLSDPADQVNFYRLFTRRNSDFEFDTEFNSVYSDIIVNGESFRFPIRRGKRDFDNNDTADFDNYGYFELGDTVYVKWCSIDKPAHDFWSTFESQGGSIGNPFSSPLRIQSNIKGEKCSGIWGSYGAFLDTIVIQ